MNEWNRAGRRHIEHIVTIDRKKKRTNCTDVVRLESIFSMQCCITLLNFVGDKQIDTYFKMA